MVHDSLAALVVMFSLWAIVSPRVPTGVLGTAGLGLMAVATLWSFDDFADPLAALDLLLGGIATVAAGVAWRVLRHRQPHMRRADDWAAPMHKLDEYHSRVSGGKRTP